MGLTQVSTDGVKNDAITKTKIPANQIEASELADNAVDTNAIANNAVTAGKLASGVQTTINNNADNRVITGSGTANTLEGEANLTYNGSALSIDGSNTTFGADSTLLNIGNDAFGINTYRNIGFGYTLNTHPPAIVGYQETHASGNTYGELLFATRNVNTNTAPTERMRIDSSGNVGVGRTPNIGSHTRALTVSNTSSAARTAIEIEGNTVNAHGVLEFRNNGTLVSGVHSRGSDRLQFVTGSSGDVRGQFTSNGLNFGSDTAAANALDDYEEGTWTPTTGNSGGGFQNIISATYTKIGRLVNVSLYAVFNSGQPNSNQIRIGGLPFQSISTIYHYAVGRLQGFASDDIVWQVGGTSDYFTPYYNNGIPTYNQVNGYYFLISGSYITDS